MLAGRVLALTGRVLALLALLGTVAYGHGHAVPSGFDEHGFPIYRVGGAQRGLQQQRPSLTCVGAGCAAQHGTDTGKLSGQRRGLVAVVLESWTINANDGVVRMTFNAGMKISTVNASAVSLQQNKTVGGVTGYQSFRMCTCTSSTSIDGPDITLAFNRTDLLQLQVNDKLGVDLASSWLIFESNFAQTLAGGYPDPILDGNAMQASEYIKDYTRPTLLSFDIDLAGAVFGELENRAAVGYLTLRFSEVVDASTLHTASLTLRAVSNYTQRVSVDGLADGENFTLTSSSFTAVGDSDVIVVTLGAADLNAIKLQRALAIDKNSTSVVMNFTAITDMKGLAVNAITKEVKYDSFVGRGWMAAMICTNYIADTTPPALVFFALDINVGLIRLTFDEAVIISSLDVTQIAIQTSSTGVRRLGDGGAEEWLEGREGEEHGAFITDADTQDDALLAPRRRLSTHTLSVASTAATGSVDAPSLIIVLGTADLAAIKSASTTKGSSFITLSAGAIKDSSFPQNAMQPVPSSAAFAANRFILVGQTGYTLDINGAPNFATLTINFNGNINPTTFDATKVTLQHAASAGRGNIGICSGVAADCGRYTLTAAGSKTAQTSLTNSLVITINEIDLNQLKLRSLVATSQGTTYLSTYSAMVNDNSGDEVTPYLDGDILYPPPIVGTFTQDTVKPTLQSYDLDMHTGTLLLHYSEAMNASSLNVTRLTLQNNRAQADGVFYSLVDSTVTSANDKSIVVRLSTRDLNTLKTIKKLAIDQAHTYLLMGDTEPGHGPAVRDMAGNSAVAIPNGAAQLCAIFTPDTGNPKLTGGLAGIRPQATSFFADFERGVLIMTFSEPVDVTTFDPTGVILMNSTYGNASEYRLSSTSYAILTNPLSTVEVLQVTAVRMELAYVLSGRNRQFYDLQFADNVAYNNQSLSLQLVVADPIKNVVDQKLHAMTSHIIAVQLSTKDLEAMAIMQNFATSMSNTFLKMESKALKDMAGNPIDPILPMAQPDTTPVAGTTSSTGALTPAFFNADSGRPRLEKYELNMDTCRMKLHFSEAMSWRSVDLEKFTLLPNAGQNQTTRGSAFYTPLQDSHQLTKTGVAPSTVVRTDSKIIEVHFGAVDCNGIRRQRPLCKSKASTWLTVDSGGARDMAGFDMMPILDGSNVGHLPQMVWKYTADITPPRLLSAKLDLKNNRMRLTFSEAIDLSKLDITKMALQEYKIRASDPDFLTDPAHTQVAFSNASFAYDMLADPTYCPSLPSTVFAGKRVSPRIVEKGTICAVAVGANGADVVMFTKDVDIAINIAQVDHDRIIAAWPVGTRAEDITEANNNVFVTVTGQFASDYSIPDPNQSSHKVVIKVSFTGGGWSVATFTEAVQLEIRNAYAAAAGVNVQQVILLNIVFATSRRLGEEGRRRLAVGDVSFEVHIFVFSESASAVLQPRMELVTDADILTDMKARVANAVMLNMIPAGATATAITAAMNLMSVTQATPVAIVIAGNAMVGISETNALGAKTVKCTSCAGIGFESRKCSFLDDRVCTACTVCPYDTWTVQPCVISTPGNVGMDTVCYRCSSCTAGKFIRRPCGGGVETVEGTQTLWTGYSVLGNLVGTPTVQGADTYCRRCRTCNINTFETRPCEMGLDRQCQVGARLLLLLLLLLLLPLPPPPLLLLLLLLLWLVFARPQPTLFPTLIHSFHDFPACRPVTPAH